MINVQVSYLVYLFVKKTFHLPRENFPKYPINSKHKCIIIYNYSFQNKKKKKEDNILLYAHILTLQHKIMHIKYELPEEILFHFFCYSWKVISKILKIFTNNIYIYMKRLRPFQFQNSIWKGCIICNNINKVISYSAHSAGPRLVLIKLISFD